MDLKGVVAVVTGAGRGIGSTTAMILAKERVTVVLAARNSESHSTIKPR